MRKWNSEGDSAELGKRVENDWVDLIRKNWNRKESKFNIIRVIEFSFMLTCIPKHWKCKKTCMLNLLLQYKRNMTTIALRDNFEL